MGNFWWSILFMWNDWSWIRCFNAQDWNWNGQRQNLWCWWSWRKYWYDVFFWAVTEDNFMIKKAFMTSYELNLLFGHNFTQCWRRPVFFMWHAVFFMWNSVILMGNSILVTEGSNFTKSNKIVVSSFKIQRRNVPCWKNWRVTSQSVRRSDDLDDKAQA